MTLCLPEPLNEPIAGENYLLTVPICGSCFNDFCWHTFCPWTLFIELLDTWNIPII